MALAQLLGASLNSEAKVFMTIRDFLAAANGIDDYSPSGPNPGPGYEIVDESYASSATDPSSGDWCVLRSFGEAGSYPVYHRLSFGATSHGLGTWLHWDVATHTGVMGANTGSMIHHNGAGDVLLYIHADLDEAHIIIKPRALSFYYWTPFGRIKPNCLTYDGTAVQLVAPLEMGDNVDIALHTWPPWAAVGKKIYNWDTFGIHELAISAVDAVSRTITVDKAYPKYVESWLAEDVCVYTYYSYSADLTSDGIVAVPNRTSLYTSTRCYGTPLSATDMLIDSKYGDRYAADVWIGAGGNLRGRFGLLRTTGVITGQSVAWQDEDGNAWRLYKPYNSPRYIALREAT